MGFDNQTQDQDQMLQFQRDLENDINEVLGLEANKKNNQVEVIQQLYRYLNIPLSTRFRNIHNKIDKSLENSLKQFLENNQNLLKEIEEIVRWQESCGKVVIKYVKELDSKLEFQQNFDEAFQQFEKQLTIVSIFALLNQSNQYEKKKTPYNLNNIQNLSLTHVKNFKSLLGTIHFEHLQSQYIFNDEIITFQINQIDFKLRNIEEENISNCFAELKIFFDELRNAPYFLHVQYFINTPLKPVQIQFNAQLSNKFQKFLTNNLDLLQQIKAITEIKANRDAAFNFLSELEGKVLNFCGRASASQDEIYKSIDEFEKKLRLLIIMDYLSKYFLVEEIQFHNLKQMKLKIVKQFQKFFLIDLQEKLELLFKNQCQKSIDDLKKIISEMDEQLQQYLKQQDLFDNKVNNMFEDYTKKISDVNTSAQNFTNHPSLIKLIENKQGHTYHLPTNSIYVQPETQRNNPPLS